MKIFIFCFTSLIQIKYKMKYEIYILFWRYKTLPTKHWGCFSDKNILCILSEGEFLTNGLGIDEEAKEAEQFPSLLLLLSEIFLLLLFLFINDEIDDIYQIIE